MSKLAGLLAKRGEIIDQMSEVSNADAFDKKKFEGLEKDLGTINEQIEAVKRSQTAAAGLARRTGGEGEAAEVNPQQRTLSQIRAMAGNRRLKGFDDYVGVARSGLDLTIDRSQHFRSLGEQLQAIFQHYASRGSNCDSRLVRAPTGAGEVDPTGGGFLVQVDFASAIFMLAHDLGEILGRVNKLPISANANGIKIPGVDETSRATGSRWGGVQSNWVAEGTAGTESRPKFRMVEFDLKKLISKMTVTDELLQDSTALSSIASQAFSEEVVFMTEDAIVEGTGAGQPLGYLNSPAKVAVAKEAGQAARTIVVENIDNMWARCWARSRKSAVWLINQDVEPQLNQLSQGVGTGGQLLYRRPGGGVSEEPFATLYGRPVIATEYSATLGTENDIALVDLSQYTLVDKNGVQMATSMHVAFDTDEMRFRLTYRVDGKPMWHAPLTPFKGSNTKSPFITLAAR
jgi:HK97 family phage major capsid protein